LWHIYGVALEAVVAAMVVDLAALEQAAAIQKEFLQSIPEMSWR
jgi:hypothetical protein